MVTKLAEMVIYLIRLLIKNSCKNLTTRYCNVTWQKILYISIAKEPIANKLGGMMTFLDGLLPIMSHDPFITWPCNRRGSAHKC